MRSRNRRALDESPCSASELTWLLMAWPRDGGSADFCKRSKEIVESDEIIASRTGLDSPTSFLVTPADDQRYAVPAFVNITLYATERLAIGRDALRVRMCGPVSLWSIRVPP